MAFTHRFFFAVLIFSGISISVDAQFYQGMQQTFGKNKVQYNEFLWTYYRFKNFDTYFYLGGQPLAAFTGKTADQDIEEIERLLDYKSSSRLQLIIFNRLSDLKQSNIGLEDEQLETGNIGGVTRVLGNKVLIYFDGNHEHFRQQVRAGVTIVLTEQLMFGGNIKDRLQSAVLLNLPKWYTEGLARYIATGWSTDDDNRMRNSIKSGSISKFSRLTDEDENFAGHSMWNFIVESYGEGAISNLLYMTRINRNIESGFNFVIGSSLKQLSQNWLEYYQKLYLNSDPTGNIPLAEPLAVRMKKNRIVQQVRISPDGMQVAYATNDLGKYRVWLYDMNTKKSRCIMRGGYKSLEQKNDLSFPLIAWHPSGRQLAVIREKKGSVWLELFDLANRKFDRSKFFYYDKVLDFSFSDDGQNMLVSGVQKGQSDLFIFNMRARMSTQLTNDIFDDLNPRFAMGSRFILFASNRSNDTLGLEKYDPELPGSHFDIFMYDFASRSSVLKRITKTPLADEWQPVALDSSRFSFLSDQSGIVNRYASTLDSVISYVDTTEHYRYIVNTVPQTNSQRNIIEHDLNLKKNRYAQVFLSGKGYKIFVTTNPARDSLPISQYPQSTPLMMKRRNSLKSGTNTNVINASEGEAGKTAKSEIEKAPRDSSKIDIENYIFQSEFPKKKKQPQENAPEPKAGTDSVFGFKNFLATRDTMAWRLPRQRNYNPSFAADYFILQLDNNFLNETYQAFTGGAVYFDPGLNGLFRFGITDLMNDYKITGGFRLSFDLNSNEYLLAYEARKKRLDHTVSFYRQAREFYAGFFLFKTHTHLFKYVAKYPFNDLVSLRGTIAYRNDRYVLKAVELFSLQVPNYFEHWASVKAELVYDNTLKTGLNLFNGFRGKVFAESFRQVNRSKTFMSVVGFDLRYYQKIHRQIIWANRLSASTSFGDQNLIYYLGSTDNAIVPGDNFNYNISIDTSRNYAFQTLASPMRGFVQNIRNGNTFALFNSELRIPLFQYLVRRPIRSDLIKNFQVVMFGDVGSAWTGLNPYGEDNSLNTEIISGNPITIILQKQIEPLVAGYGVGLRSRVLGYFLKADWAWGYQDGNFDKRIFYLSLGLDF